MEDAKLLLFHKQHRNETGGYAVDTSYEFQLSVKISIEVLLEITALKRFSTALLNVIDFM